MQLDQLIFIKEIGYGQFGNVFLVEDEQQNQYALKCVTKCKVEALSLERQIQVSLF